MLADAKGAWDAIQPVMWLAGVLFAGSILFLIAKRWKAFNEARQAGAESGELKEYRELYEEGVISEQEFKRLQALLTGRLKEKALPEPPPSSDQPAPEDNPESRN